MMRYFFHQRNGYGNILDYEGAEMATNQEAIARMRSLLVRMIQEEIPGDEYGAIFVNVRDSDGNHVSSASVSIQTEESGDERRSPTTTANHQPRGRRRDPQRRT